MCFSASASFVTGAGLSAAGAETIRQAKTRERMPVAAMPILFGIQQAVEGVVWVSFNHPIINTVATHIFVFFSHVLWPTYVPFAILMIEKEEGRRLILKILLLIGLATSLNLLFHSLLIGTPFAYVSGNSIAYETSLPAIPLGIGFYVLATCLACLVSSHKFMRIFGMALIGSFAIAYWSYAETFYSVWCFFAAILSFIIYVHLKTDIIGNVKASAKAMSRKAESAIKSKLKMNS